MMISIYKFLEMQRGEGRNLNYIYACAVLKVKSVSVMSVL